MRAENCHNILNLELEPDAKFNHSTTFDVITMQVQQNANLEIVNIPGITVTVNQSHHALEH